MLAPQRYAAESPLTAPRSPIRRLAAAAALSRNGAARSSRGILAGRDTPPTVNPPAAEAIVRVAGCG
jgi:hypothetical protein